MPLLYFFATSAKSAPALSSASAFCASAAAASCAAIRTAGSLRSPSRESVVRQVDHLDLDPGGRLVVPAVLAVELLQLPAADVDLRKDLLAEVLDRR